ncbi:MAG: hypothetical protein J5779_03525, partial [Clostridia bacterium]|nr:hypothetical protein [Clostridia bacterium]
MATKKEKGKFKTKKQFIPAEMLVGYSKAISTLANAFIGFDPNENYAVDDKFLPSQVPSIPRNIKTVQESSINLDQSIADEIIDSKKYIYSIEPRIYEEDGIHKCKVYVLKMVQQTQQGVIPSVLILSNLENFENGYKIQKSAFSACLNGKKYITLDRMDALAQFKHENFVLDNDGIFRQDSRPEKRLIRARLSHRHIYNQEVLLNRSKSIVDNYGHKQQDSKLKTYA